MSIWDDYNESYGPKGIGQMFGIGRPDPYKDAMKQYEEWMNKAQQVQNPYLQAGQGGMKNYQDWLGGQKDPSGFINNLMNQYQESPYAHNEQQQSMRAFQNMGSASGMTGSTPLMQQAQQNAGNISSQDQNQWLQHVLGINTQYGQGQNNLMQGGQNAANTLSGMYGNMGNNMAGLMYGRGQRQLNDSNMMMAQLLKILPMIM